MTVRQQGLVFAISGIALTAVAIGLASLNLGGAVAMVGAMLIVVPPAMVTVGIAMAVAPGDNPRGLEFGDWLESVPMGKRVLFYAIGALGLGLGVLMVFALGGWTVEGVIDIVL